MKKAIRIIFCLNILISLNANAQLLSGVITDSNDSWDDYVLISEISHFYDFFSGSSSIIIDTIHLDARGGFTYGKKLKPNHIYRLNIISKENPAFVINNGINDNYSFFITPAITDSKIVFRCDADSMYLSGSYIGSTSTYTLKNVQTVEQIKLPVYVFLKNVFQNMAKVGAMSESEKNEYMHSVMLTRDSVLRTTNVELAKYMNDIKDPVAKVFAFAYYIYDNNFSNHLSIISKQRELVSNKSDTSQIVQSFLSEFEKAKQKVNDEILTYTFVSYDGDSVVIKNLESEIIILDFWASWCAPCRKEIKSTLKELKNNNDNLIILGVNMDDNVQNAEKAILDDDNRFTQLFRMNDNNKKIIEKLGVSFLPHYVVYDKKKNTLTQMTSTDLLNFFK